MRDHRRHVVEDDLHLSAQHIGERRRCAAIGNVLHFHAGHRHEQFAREMHRRAVARRGHVHLAGIGLGVGDELRNGFCRNVRAHRHDVRRARDASDGHDIANEVEVQLGIKRGVDRIRRIDQQNGVAVGRGVHDRFGADVVSGSGLVLDDELLAEPLRQPLRDHARGDVGAAAGREWHDDAHRTRWIGLRHRDARQRRQRDRGCGEMQKLPARKCHEARPGRSASAKPTSVLRPLRAPSAYLLTPCEAT